MKENLHNILHLDKDDKGILRLTMDDQNNKNALSELMMNELISAINGASNDNSIKVIVIAAKGDVFCSGHNLKEITEARSNDDEGASFFINLFKLCSSLMQLIVNSPKPVIAEVDGIATAAGCQLVVSCDLAISSDTAKFATPGVNIGLFCSTPMVALSRNVNKKDAMKMLLTGDMIDANEAKRISLINDHVSHNQLTESVLELAKKISKKSSITVKTGKEAFYKQYEMSLHDAYEYTSIIMTENTLRDDAKEGINAFFEKRDPNWRDN
jgi:enoyl-CoA hydratase/carnithine racemase